jgi:hypothetical protein
VLVFVTIMWVAVLGVDVFRVVKRARIASLARDDMNVLVMSYSIALLAALAVIGMATYFGPKIGSNAWYWMMIGVVAVWQALSGCVLNLLVVMAKNG